MIHCDSLLNFEQLGLQRCTGGKEAQLNQGRLLTGLQFSKSASPRREGPTWGIFSLIVSLWVLEPGNLAGVDARRTLTGRGRSGSGLAGGCSGDALPEGQLSLSHALRPHAQAAGRCACALRAHTICAVSQCAGLCRAGCERRQRGANGAEEPHVGRRADSGSVRERRAGLGPRAPLSRDGEEAEKQERRQVSPYLGPLGGGRRGSGGRAAPTSSGWTRVEARDRPRKAAGLGGHRGPETPVPGRRGGPRRLAGSPR